MIPVELPPRGLGAWRRRRQVLPGLLPTLGFTWLYAALLVILPLSILVIQALGAPPERIFEIATAPRTVAALRLTFSCALAAAGINAVLGLVVAWVLARYRFPGIGLLDAIVELPFALPTAVAGITLTFLYAKDGWLGQLLSAVGVDVAFTPLGIVLALIFVGFPFSVRTVQPIVQELDRAAEEASLSLGATRWQTFSRVQLPVLLPAILTGFSLAMARGIGEYGSVLFISGNLPFKTEIAPLLIVTRLEQYDYEGAAVVATVLLLASVALLAFVALIERWAGRRYAGVRT